jgi:RHS repeat-associated protein
LAAYSLWGTQVIKSGSKSTPFGFQGSYSDATGLIYLVDRYYDPSTAQFLSIDPDVAETGQPYAYTADDPLNKTDPTGLNPGDVYETALQKPIDRRILARGAKTRGRFPGEAESGEILYRTNEKGITSYEVYGPKGLPVKRVDLQGASHYEKSAGEDIPTPHVQTYVTRESPDGTEFVNRGPVRAATNAEIPSQAFQDVVSAPYDSPQVAFHQAMCDEDSTLC